MGKLKTTPWDSAEYLTTPKQRALYLEITIEETEGDTYFVMKTLETIARSIGMEKVVRKSGFTHEQLHEILSGDHDPGFATIVKIMAALGLQFHVVAR